MKKRRYLALGLLLLLLCALLITWIFLPEPPPEPAQVEENVQQSVESTPPQEAREPEKPEEPYISPVDFAALQEMNPDIYAWLYVPGTDINYPLLQREGDDAYYLDRNSQGEKDKNGSLFTESAFNAKDFTDPVTVIYGHHMKSGAMFGNLQATYSSAENLEKFGEMVVYLPEEEIHYQVFAGVPFSGAHLLYYYDFSDEGIYQAFLDYIHSFRALDANFLEGSAPDPGEQMLVLSTCLQGNNKRRYLVLAKRTDDRNFLQSE